MATTTVTAAVVPTREELVARARALAPRLRERAEACEAARSVPRESIEEIVDAGLGRILQPRRWGGWELDFTTAGQVAVELGRGCGSTAWCASFLNVHDWYATLFAEEAQQDVWGDGPDVNVASATLPMGRAEEVDGGLRVSGEWPWSSGIDHADWVVLGSIAGPPQPGSPPDIRLLLVPEADFAIRDTWFNVGLRGTGSKNVVVDDGFVPAHRVVLMADFLAGSAPGLRTGTGAIHRVTGHPVPTSAVITPALGIAQGAYDAWRAGAAGKASADDLPGTVKTLPHRITAADVRARIDAVELLVHRGLATLDQGEALTERQRVDLRRDFAWSAQELAHAMRDLLHIGGAYALFDSSPIQRAWRDVSTIANHAACNLELAGDNSSRLALGLPRNPFDPSF